MNKKSMSLIVTLNRDYDIEEELPSIITAISMIRGVFDVCVHPVTDDFNFEKFCMERQLKSDLLRKLSTFIMGELHEKNNE